MTLGAVLIVLSPQPQRSRLPRRALRRNQFGGLRSSIKRLARAPVQLVRRAAPVVRKLAPVAALAAGAGFLGPALSAKFATALLPALLQRRAAQQQQQLPPDVLAMQQLPPEYQAAVLAQQRAPVDPGLYSSALTSSGGGGGGYADEEPRAPRARSSDFQRYLPWIAAGGAAVLGAAVLSRRR